MLGLVDPPGYPGDTDEPGGTRYDPGVGTDGRPPLQSSLFDGVGFDPFSFEEDGLASAEVDVGRRQFL